jgi:hypothetical protein
MKNKMLLLIISLVILSGCTKEYISSRIHTITQQDIDNVHKRFQK